MWLLASPWKPTVDPSHKMDFNSMEEFGFETLYEVGGRVRGGGQLKLRHKW